MTKKPSHQLEQRTYHTNKEKATAHPVQINIYKINQNNTHRKDVSWLYFDVKTRVQERP